MQNIEAIPAEDELIKLLLKRQTELNALLEVTQAINRNAGTTVLVQMLQVILKSYLQVGRFRFLIEQGGTYHLISKYGGEIEPLVALNNACSKLKKAKTAIPLANHEDGLLKNYDYFIPIYHKKQALAFVLIANFNTSGELLYNDLSFIQTLVNVIVVALENKKLFKERIKSERFLREMELAGEVQNMLMPLKTYKDDFVEIAAKYIPHQTIGGDYFDFKKLNQTEYLMCIADVSGKGISAALLMSNFQASLFAWSSVESDLTSIIKKLNKIVLDNTKGEKFITLFLGKYNTETRKLNYINAGHNAPILYADGKTTTLKSGTTMIGALDDLPFVNQEELYISPGSLLINYTDGLLDHENPGLKDWEEEDLIQFVGNNGNKKTDKFNKLLFDYINNDVKGTPIDDVTILTLLFY